MKLTPKQKAFCEEYLIDLNATQAAIRAGYSEKTAKEQGCQHLTKLNIQTRIIELQSARSERTEITSDYVLTGIRETTEQARSEDKLSDSFRGYELLGKHLKLFTDKLDLGGGFTITEALAGIDEPDTDEIGEDETKGDQE